MKASFPRKNSVAQIFDPDNEDALPCPSAAYDGNAADGRRRRVRLWELPQKLHCPVIGTCLTPRELARIAQRHRLPHDARDAYALHVEAVGWAGQRSAVSRDLHRHLDGKYAPQIERFAPARSAEEVLALWKAQWSEGNVAGAMWAALTSGFADDAARHVVYADVHMLSHQVGAGLAAGVRQLRELTERNEALATALQKSRADAFAGQALARKLSAELDRVRAELCSARQTGAALQARLTEFESGQAVSELRRQLRTVSAANEELAAVAGRVPQLQAALAEATERAARLARERDDATAERDALERLVLAAEGEPATGDAPCEVCPEAARRRCVLCVGGRPAHVSHYRQLAERLGLRLIHHDGGREEALSRLPELIAAADAVLCPTDCVSHNAYYMLKRHCKRTGKRCLLFKGAGLSGFAVALARLAEGQTSLTGSGRR